MRNVTPDSIELDAHDACQAAQAAMGAKDWPRVMALLGKVLTDSVSDWPLKAFLDFGHAATQLGFHAKAAAAYEKARERDPANAAGWRGGAFAASRRGAWGEAAELWRGCMARSPEANQQVWWWSALGEALSKLEQWEEASATYATMRERWPDNPLGWRGGAFVASRRTEWAAAVEFWQGCIARAPRESHQAWWLSGLADALSRLRRNGEAADIYAELRERWPSQAAGWRGAALQATRLDDWPLAADFWEGLVGHVPEQERSLSVMASCIHAQIRAGRWQAAGVTFRNMLQQWPDDPSGWRSLFSMFTKELGARGSVRIWEQLGGHAAPGPQMYQKDVIDLLLQAGRNAEAAERIEALRAECNEGASWLAARISLLQARGDDRAAFDELVQSFGNPGYRGSISADKVAAMAFAAAIEVPMARQLMNGWFGEDVAEASIRDAFTKPVATPEIVNIEWKPSQIPMQWEDWSKDVREKFRRFQADRRYGPFRDFIEWAVRKASPLRLRRLLTVAEGRFPESRTAIKLRAMIVGKTVPASTPEEAFASRWRHGLPPPGLSIASQLQGRPWRRLVCILTIRDEDELLPRFIRHYRRLGVESFIVIDNASANDPALILEGFKDCEITLVRGPGRFADSRNGIMWVNEIAELGLSDWLLLVDGDELLLYPGSGNVPIATLLEHMDRRGETAFMAPMMDVYDPGFANGANVSSNPDDHVLIDADLMFEHSLLAPWKKIQGGVRTSIVGNLVKTPLFKASAGVRRLNNHNVTSCRLAATTGALIHLKLFRDRQLLDMQPQEVARHSRVRDRTINCLGRHMAFPKWVDQRERISPFQTRLSTNLLLKIGYVSADAGWRARCPVPLPENVLSHAESLPRRPTPALTDGNRIAFRNMTLPEIIAQLCDAARQFSRPELRALINAHFSRMMRRDVKLAVLLPVANALGRNALSFRILRLLRASVRDNLPCVTALKASADALKPKLEMAQDVLEMIVEAGVATQPIVADLAAIYSLSSHYSKITALLSTADLSLTDGTLIVYLRALQRENDWENFIGRLNTALTGVDGQPLWRLLHFIACCPFSSARQDLLAKLEVRMRPEADQLSGAAAITYLVVLDLLGYREECAAAFVRSSGRIPDASRRYFERLFALRRGEAGFNRFWCVGLSKTGTTSFHDYCNGIGLLSAHFVNPHRRVLITREDTEVFDVESDIPVVYLARTSGVPEGRGIVHTTRRFDEWARSFLAHYGKGFNLPGASFDELNNLFRSGTVLRFNSVWIDIQHELYFRFRSLREAYDYHHDWVRSLAKDGVPFLEVPLEAPDEMKAEMISRFMCLPDRVMAYPQSNKTYGKM